MREQGIPPLGQYFSITAFLPFQAYQQFCITPRPMPVFYINLQYLLHYHSQLNNMQPQNPKNHQQQLVMVEGMEPIPVRQLLSNSSLAFYIKHQLWSKISNHALNAYSIIPKDDSDRIRFSQLFAQMKAKKDYSPKILKLDIKCSRAVASFLGLAICDALGASTQFMPYDASRNIIKRGFRDVDELIKTNVLEQRQGRNGIWTDDCSMALSIADSLMLNSFKFDPVHTRYLFILWLQHGLNNGGRPYSIGLGGNISLSMTQFLKEPTQFAHEGDRLNNGNGSLMRLAPLAICFNDNEKWAMDNSESASRTTHNGDEAKQCSRLLAMIIVRLIHRPVYKPWKQCIMKACSDFKTDIKSVKYLAMSQQEPLEFYQWQVQKYGDKFKQFNQIVEDRNWNWKKNTFAYSPTRLGSQPEYVGSYCMDALAMALHTVWHAQSFLQISLRNANLGGDCDTVGAIAGQIGGAIYGIDKQMMRLYSEMVDFSESRYQIFLKGYKLFFRGKK